jgi:hypothetical protein
MAEQSKMKKIYKHKEQAGHKGNYKNEFLCGSFVLLMSFVVNFLDTHMEAAWSSYPV